MAKVEVERDMVRSFHGEGDVVAWLKKLKLVAKLKKIDDLASFLPLYLEGDALALYLEMGESEQSDANKIEERLKEAFTEGMFVAHGKLCRMRWTGEQVDVYANGIRRLAGLAGFTGEGLAQIVKLTFVNGFPDDISIALQQMQNVNKLEMTDLVARARVVASRRGSNDDGSVVAVVARESTRARTGEMEREKRGLSVVGGHVRCFRCSGPHFIRDCKEPKQPVVCYKCHRVGHIASFCEQGNDQRRVSAPEATPARVKALPGSLPVVEIFVGKRGVNALVDTGCSNTVVTSRVTGDCSGVSTLVAFDGRQVECRGTTLIELSIREIPVTVRATVVDSVINGVDVILGMDVVNRLGGVTVEEGKVTFGRVRTAATIGLLDGTAEKVEVVNDKTICCEIKDKDFHAKFDGECWTVEWFWRENVIPNLKNRVSCYAVKGETKEKFEKEVERWIEEGILQPWKENVKEGVLPLMAVVQSTKNKVRPVLDYRELNKYVECHTGDDFVDVCGETLRKWRQVAGGTKIVDLKSAYLQIRISKNLWCHQLVNYKGKTYCLTRLGFGLNSAPRIMSIILKTTLGKDEVIKAATNSYVDDILVDETIATAVAVKVHLGKFGLVTKPPEALVGGAALGLRLDRNKIGEVVFRRGNEIPEWKDDLCRRELFSMCGKLVGHYPIAGWLRVACSYIKRMAEGVRWEDKIGQRTCTIMKEIVEIVKREDPVRGIWNVPKLGRGVVWCDASSIATGVVLEIDGVEVEDAAWLRKKTDYSHINVAELDAVLKGINVALKWGLRDIELRTDSATVLSWVKSVIEVERRVRTKGASEMIVKRRLGILKEMIDEFHLTMNVVFVSSEKNRADKLTRVRKAWLGVPEGGKGVAGVCCSSNLGLKDIHEMHHMGVDRSLYLARKVDPEVTRADMSKIVRNCERCQSIDPAPSVHDSGEIQVSRNWQRLAIDVTHYRHVPYLSMVDCGPGRVAIWRELRMETASDIICALNEIFFERGPVEEILMDNGTVFRSKQMEEFLCRWRVKRFFRAAYRASGNGIVERHHRTIKTLAERGRISPIEAVFWYNMSPRSGQDERSVPQKAVFCYEWRHPGKMIEDSCEGAECAKVVVGEEVWVKPPNARCTSRWRKGKVSQVNSRSNVSVDGMPRHILDIRKVVSLSSAGESSSDGDITDDHESASEGGERRRSQRERCPPVWARDYHME